MGWLQERRERKRREEEAEARFATDLIVSHLANRRTIACSDVAILIVENDVTHERMKPIVALAPLIGLAKLSQSEEERKKEQRDEERANAERDARIASVLGPILRMNPQADLAEYEKTFGIKIVKVDIIAPQSKQARRSVDI